MNWHGAAKRSRLETSRSGAAYRRFSGQLTVKNRLMLLAFVSDVTVMTPPRLIRRWLQHEPATSLMASRTDVRPPALWSQAEPVWKALWHWLCDSDKPDLNRASALESARLEFGDALAELQGDDARDLLRRGVSARSLRELWHLRAELYCVVSRHRSQAEADRRLALVNRHFPTSTTPSPTASRHGPRHIL